MPAGNYWRPDVLLIENDVVDTAVARRARAALPDVPVVEIEDARVVYREDRARDGAVDTFGAGKRRLLLYHERGRFLTACQAGTPGLVCCSYLVLGLVSNCPYDCSYCFLQEYLASNPLLRAATNVADALSEVASVLDAHPGHRFRIGTGELSDSLVLEPLLGHAADLVSFVAERPNVTLELKTKCDRVDDILGLGGRGHVVISWSLTPPSVSAREEPGTASFGARLAAAARCQVAGYRVGFHFDPLVDNERGAEDYRDMIRALARGVDVRRVAWFSLGSLRVTPRLRRIVRERHPESRVLLGEYVPCPDAKWRVFQARRVTLYRRVYGWLRDVAPEVPVYLCMERPEVWTRVFGGAVPGDGELGALLTA